MPDPVAVGLRIANLAGRLSSTAWTPIFPAAYRLGMQVINTKGSGAVLTVACHPDHPEMQMDLLVGESLRIDGASVAPYRFGPNQVACYLKVNHGDGTGMVVVWS